MKEHRLWYESPASRWTEALPLGNGRMGAMVWGGIDEEVVSLYEGTLWSGYPDPWYNPRALEVLPQVREHLWAGRRAEAQALVESQMAGRWTQAFLPLGRLRCTRAPGAHPSSYHRALDLSRALVQIRGSSPLERWEREAFVSARAGVLVYRFRSNRASDWTIRLESDLRGHVEVQDDGLSWSGVAPQFVVPSYLPSDNPVLYGSTPETSGMRYTMRCRIESDGVLERTDGSVTVRGCRYLSLVVAAATSFVDRRTHPFTHGADEQARVVQTLAKVPRGVFEHLRREHEADHRHLYDRATLELAGSSEAWVPTDHRLRRVAAGSEDPGLAALGFHLGRYLLIASSRPGGQPTPLQGLWNEDLRPAWSANYTTNINTEMNYWPAEVTNLAECHQPLLDFVADVAEAGEEVARRHYGARGWTAHHNLDLWAHPIPAGDSGGWFPGSACHLFWPLGGAWLAHHLWEHFAFGRDRTYLADKAWPVLKGAVRFCLDWLVEAPDGTLTTAPSTSPENKYRVAGTSHSVDVGTSSDLASIRQLLLEALEACRILDTDEELVQEMTEALPRLGPCRTTASGALAEWSQDFEPDEPGHRHFSHLYGLFPGNHLGPQHPESFAAARQAVQERLNEGGAGTGWSLAWLVCLQARLGDGTGAGRALHRWLGTSVFSNLFDLHPSLPGHPGVFQIDGNLGITAGIAELLVQSQADEIHLLPALPPEWTSGRVTGLRVRGDVEVALEWADGDLVWVEIVASQAGDCTLRRGRTRVKVTTTAGRPTRLERSDFDEVPGSP